jgi:HAD superfamily hydrolase (TIGR01509 family)
LIVDLHFRAVLFDLFDTLVLFDEVKNDYPIYLDRMYEALLNCGVNVSFEVFKKTYFEVRNEIIERSRKTLEEPHFNLRISLTMQRLGFTLTEQDKIVTNVTKAFSNEFKSRTRPDPNAKNVLQQLHQTYKLGLVSNFNIPECSYELLDQFGLKQFLDAVVISGTVNRRKPSPEIFSIAIKALGVEAPETIFVGDSLSDDIQGPQNIGMKAILIKRRPIPEDNKVKPDAIVEWLSELPRLITVLK